MNITEKKNSVRKEELLPLSAQSFRAVLVNVLGVAVAPQLAGVAHSVEGYEAMKKQFFRKVAESRLQRQRASFNR